MNRLRLGVIGAGSWAVTAHLPALARRREEVEFAAVCRRGREEVERVGRRFGFAVASEDYREVVEAGIDICIVASPASLHYEHAAAALQAGAHVLCEKPMTIDPAEAWSLVDLARRCDRQLLVSFGWNYAPMIRRAKELVERHGIGELEHMTLHMSSSTRELLTNSGAYPDADPDMAPDPRTWTDPALSGGGYGQAQLTHALGLALHLVPERVVGAHALMSRPRDGAVEVHDVATLRFSAGGIGALSGGSAHRGAGGDKHALELRAIGRDGQLLVDVEREAVWLYRPGAVDERLSLQPGDGAYRPDGPAHALVDVARGAANDCAPGHLGAEVVEALALVHRSAASGTWEQRS